MGAKLNLEFPISILELVKNYLSPCIPRGNGKGALIKKKIQKPV
jgi:hypothetical protein